MKRIEGDGMQVPESVLKRDMERKEKMSSNRIDNDNDDNKRFDYFCETFKNKRQEIEDALEETKKAAEVDPTSVPERFREIAEKLRLLNKFVFTSSCYLRAYDVRSSKEVIQALEESTRRLENRLLPKKKFGFKTKKTGVVAHYQPSDPPVESKTVSQSVVDGKVEEDDREFCGFRHLHGRRELRLGPDQTHHKDLKLHNLADCSVVIMGNPNTLRISSISNTVIACSDGRVMTSVMIEESKNSCVAVACQQLRIHVSRDTELYLDVTTGPIIEDCTGLGFAPYPPSLMSEHITGESTWAAVDDFDWLSPSKPSPNWRILPISERVSEWPQ